MQVEKVMPPELIQFARETYGDYATRYAAIVRRAFKEHLMMLNVRQLRQLAGGGSNTSAQKAITDFRAELHQTTAVTFDLGDEVPEHLVAEFSRLVPAVWGTAKRLGEEAFNVERLDFTTKLAQARDEARQASEGLERALQAVELLNSQLEAATTSLGSTKAQLDSVQNGLRVVTEERDQIAAAASRDAALHIEHLAKARAEHHADIEKARTERELADRAAKEQLAAVRADHTKVVDRLVAERNLASQERDQARSERANADIAQARAEQIAYNLKAEVERATKLAADAQAEAAQVRSEFDSLVQSSRAELATVEEAAAADLAEAKARAVDVASILEWFTSGCQKDGIAALGQVEQAIAISAGAALGSMVAARSVVTGKSKK